MMDKPSIYRIAPADTSPRRRASPGRHIVDLLGFQFGVLPYARTLSMARQVAEVAQARDAIWAADQRQMASPEAQAELPSDSDAVLDGEKEMS